MDSMPSLYRTSHFGVYFLGKVQDINLGGISTRDPDIQLIDRIEEAQLDGKLNMIQKDEEKRMMSVSKYGIKVTDTQKLEVFQRHPLHTVAQIVYYEDSFFKNNIALKIGSVGRNVFDCYVFQCQGEDQAQSICQCVKDVFETVTGRIP
ncbi:hypothetical protein CAPTEDRAFT_198158 [Capitella teleta]|uniref:PID domain-containing protein n=1 Tax=Capitella teleta TaxID=283909 RepID=X1ZYC3_CAPTE|nr:hypothetical protein CAPTEDRAFT_198158 [Capitella teleta]|eukprot:ELU04706.1 hypothetical protein CAPTEDRAFT_198158 [Capitella teleta]